MNRTFLRDWYDDLPCSERRRLRQKLMRDCGISRGTFYNYLQKEPPKLVKIKMQALINLPGKKLWQQTKQYEAIQENVD